MYSNIILIYSVIFIDIIFSVFDFYDWYLRLVFDFFTPRIA